MQPREELAMTNPWMSLWLSVANSWAGAARGFWMAEMHRQQTALANEMVRQTLRFWTSGWPAPGAARKPARRR
jgi:hypothetical protein